MSQLFGKIKKKPTKEQYAEELLDSDFKNLGRAVTGDEANDEDAKLR